MSWASFESHDAVERCRDSASLHVAGYGTYDSQYDVAPSFSNHRGGGFLGQSRRRTGDYASYGWTWGPGTAFR